MSEPWPAEIQVSDTPGGVCFRLPRRPPGWPALLGGAAAIFGLTMLGLGGAFAAAPLSGPPEAPALLWLVGLFLGALLTGLLGVALGADEQAAAAGIGLGLVGVSAAQLVVGGVCLGQLALARLGGEFGPTPFRVAGVVLLLAGIIPAFGGCWMVAGHDRVEITPTRLRRSMVLGPLRWVTGVTCARVSQLTLEPGVGIDKGVPYARLHAEGEGVPPLAVALGYPPDWLRALARALAERWPGAAVPVFEENNDPEVVCDRAAPPVNSRVRVDRGTASVMVALPSPGLAEGGFGCLVVVLVVGLAFATIPLGVAAFATVVDAGHVALAAGFWLAVAAGLAALLRWGRRCTVVAVKDGRLAVRQISLLGAWWRTWPAGDVKDVRLAADRDEENNVWHWRFAISLRDGTSQVLATWRHADDYHRKADLEWATSVLRAALRSGPPAPG